MAKSTKLRLKTGSPDWTRANESAVGSLIEINQEPVIPTENTEASMVPEIAGLGAAKKSIFRVPNQKGVPEGQTRWYCHECDESFLAAAGETPQTCPQGHQSS